MRNTDYRFPLFDLRCYSPKVECEKGNEKWRAGAHRRSLSRSKKKLNPDCNIENIIYFLIRTRDRVSLLACIISWTSIYLIHYKITSFCYERCITNAWEHEQTFTIILTFYKNRNIFRCRPHATYWSLERTILSLWGFEIASGLPSRLCLSVSLYLRPQRLVG